MIETDRELEKQLIKHEDLKLKPYRCSAGKLTIGVGRNIEDNGITEAESMVMLRNDIIRSRMELKTVIGNFPALSERRQRALIDMNFNLGLSRFIGFAKMIQAVRDGDFNRAADEMMDSLWAKQVGNQPGQRAHTLAAMMREG